MIIFLGCVHLKRGKLARMQEYRTHFVYISFIPFDWYKGTHKIVSWNGTICTYDWIHIMYCLYACSVINVNSAVSWSCSIHEQHLTIPPAVKILFPASQIKPDRLKLFRFILKWHNLWQAISILYERQNLMHFFTQRYSITTNHITYK